MNEPATQSYEELLQLLDCMKVVVFELAEEQGLTRTQLTALYWIDQHGSISMSQAADVLHCDASNITGMVNRLMAQGLVDREAKVTDRRTKHLTLTEKGKQVIALLRAELPKRMGCDRLTEEERLALHTIVQKICGPSVTLPGGVKIPLLACSERFRQQSSQS